MPVIANLEELLGLLGGAIASEDPLAKLAQQGFSLAPQVRQALDAAKPSKPLSPDERQRFARAAARLGTVRFHVRPRLPLPSASLPEGEADLIASFRVGVLNETLAALFGGMEWPKQIEPKHAATFFSLAELRDFSDDVPTTPLMRVGALHLTAPASLAPVPGTENVLLTLPFSLDIVRTIGFSAVKVSSLDGQLRFGVALKAEVQGDELRLLTDAVIAEPTDEEKTRLTVEPASPIQPRSLEALAALEQAIGPRIQNQVFLKLATTDLSISPVVHLPLGKDTPLRIQLVQVRCVGAGDSGVVRVAVLFEGSPEVVPSATILGQFPFAFAEPNVHLRVHEDLLRKIARAALESGALQNFATKLMDDLRVEAIDVNLRPNELRLTIDAHVVDACAFINVDFRATGTFRFSVSDGEFRIVAELTEIDWDNTDVIACAITALIALSAAAAVSEIFAFFFARELARTILFLLALEGLEAPLPVSSAFDPLRPIPGTEVLPRVEARQVAIDNSTLQSVGLMTLRPDNINTFVYAAFMRRVGPSGLTHSLEPITGAPVELKDQDLPLTLPGEAPAPPDTFEVLFKNARRIVTLSTHFEPPKRDERLAGGKTDAQGRVKFVLTPDEVETTSGVIIATRVTEHLDTQTTDMHKTRQARVETRPDLYFRVRPSEGDLIDTRSLAGGLLVNLTSRHVGRPDAPLTFVVAGGPVIDPG